MEPRARASDSAGDRAHAQARPLERKRKREVDTPADARIASRPRLDDPPAARPAAASESSRVGYDGGPANNQLVDYERWLDPSDLKLLRSQRDQQCERLSTLVRTAFRRKVDSQSCFRLARENVLARHNGYGLALVFLHRSVPAEENTRRLVDYLLILSKSTFQASLRERGDLGRCADLAAHYVLKTNWFEDTPLHRLADLGNMLSKHPNRPACIEATAWIADQVLKPGRLPRLDGKQLALLANAFSKHTGSARCERAVARLANQLLHEPVEVLAAQSVALLLNAVSRWPDNGACRAAAEHLAVRLDRDDRLRRALSAQEVASALNALSKWPEADACQKAAEHLAARLDRESGLLRAMDAQGVANALNALSKWPEAAACSAAGERLAARLDRDDGLLRAMNAQGVANALSALSKWPETRVCRDAAEHLAARLDKDDRLRRTMSAQHVSNALGALAKWPDTGVCQKAAECLAARLVVDAGLRHALDARGVSNALNALSKWPKTVACGMAAEHLADRLAVDAELRHALDAQGMANALGALGKWPEADACSAAAEHLATLLAGHDRLRQAMRAQEVANALNGLSKRPETEACRAAAEYLAARLAEDAGLLQAMNAQQVANALNALGKWPDADACRAAGEHLAAQLAEEAGLQQAMDAQEISNALNALGKWSDAEACHAAAGHLAVRLAEEDRLRQDLNAQEVANALNGLSKWPETGACRAAAEHLAARLIEDDRLQQAMSARQVATALGALSKWPDSDACRAAAEYLAVRLDSEADLLDALTAQGISSTLNALSKWPDSENCRETAISLADRLSGDAGLRQAMDAQGVANALNALSKWPEADPCRTAAGHLADRLSDDAGLRHAMSAQHVSNALNALSKWPDAEGCLDAAVGLVARLTADAGLQQAMNGQGIANTLNALSKWPQDARCREAAVGLVETLGSGGRPFCTFGMRALAQVANGMARIAVTIKEATAPDNDAEQPDSATLVLMHARLRELAAHLNVRPGGFDDAGTRSIAMIFKALSSTGLKDGLKLLADQGLRRLQALHAQTGFRPDDLEALGTLAAGLLPLVRAPELKLYRSSALRLLEQMQPDVARKVQNYADAHLASAGTATATRSPEGEALGTRCPGLTFFLLLKTYAVVASMWKLHNVPDDPVRIGRRREELKAWIGSTLAQVRGRIEADLDEMSWNLIAQIEAGDDVLDALDLKLWRDLDRIVTAHPPTPLDVASVRRELRALPEVRDLMDSDAGAATLQLIDMRGHIVRSGTDAAAQYSFFTRLTGGKLPLLEVELPGKLSAFMLARTIRRDGDLLRMDLFGGSHLTPQSVRIFERLAEARSIKHYGRIPVVRLADTAPDAPLMKDVIRKLNPQREDWYRMQRALLEVVPRDHVVEGPVRLALLADQPQGAEPAFALRTPEGEPIRLVSHDGCGFIRESLARRIPAMAQAMDAWQLASRKGPEALPTQRQTILPAQATHHYPRNEAAIEEARGRLRRALCDDATLWETDAFSGARRISKPKLYDLLIAGGVKGVQGVAVPSADDKLYLPGEKSAPFDRTGGAVLLGKPPYDKPNLMPIPAERVGTSAQGDATARFLETAFAFQYSYTAWDENRPDADDAPMLHGKGVTIVVPDALWPQDNDAQWAWSTEDMKVHSSWTQRRERDRLPARMNTVGSLRLKDVFTPGSLIAVPINELGKRDADCDGDRVFVYAGLPKMTQAITGFFEERERRIGRTSSFKPPKTASTVFDEKGRYRAGRAAEVLSAVRGRELVQRMSTLQFHLWGQPPAVRERIAESAIFGTYEGTRRELRRGLRRVLYNPAEATPAQLQALREWAELGVEHALHPTAHEAATVLRSQLDAFIQDPQGTREAEAQPQALPPALAQRFATLAEAYAQARTPRERLAALVGHYPTALLPHPGTILPTDPPPGTDPAQETQLGYVPGAPLETLRNLLTLGVKVGTDAPKAVTQTDVYLKIAGRLERALHSEPDRIRFVPYTKGGLLPKLRDGLDIQAEQRLLRDNPTLAAGLMEMALEELQERGLIDGAPAPGDVSADTESRLRQLAHDLRTAAGQSEAHMTRMLDHAIHGIGVQRGEMHRLKSEHSLFDKLRRLMHKERQTPEEAAAAVDDALRYSVALDPETFVRDYAAILGALDAQGLTRIRVRNSFGKSHAAFRAVNVGFIGRDGDGKAVRLEIQFHTQQTFDLKEQFHDDYKLAQSLHLAGASREQQHAELAQAWGAFDTVAIPPGCTSITDWDIDPPRTDRRRTVAVRAGANPHVDRLVAQARTVWREVGPMLEAIGLDIAKHHSVPKHAASIEQKIERYQVLRGLPIEQAAARVRDAMRWVVLLPAEHFAAGFEQARQALEDKGLRMMRINNGFAAAGTTYAGLNATLRTASGLDFEVQFHTVDSLRARNTGHRTYRKWQHREVEVKREQDPAKRLSLQQANARLLQEMKARAAKVSLPAGVKDIASFSAYRDAAVSQASLPRESRRP